MIKLSEIENDDIRNTLKLVNPRILKNCDLMNNSEFNHTPTMHISTKVLKYFIPIVSKIAGPSEDNTFPRIHTARTFFECLIARGLLNNRFNELILSKYNSEFTGVMFIYQIPFEYALKPNKNLVFDAEVTNELWLFTYDKNTMKYYPSYVNEFIQTEVTIVPGTMQKYKSIYTILLNVVERTSVNIDNKTILQSGYYELKIEQKIEPKGPHGNNYELLSHKRIDSRDFLIKKQENISLEKFKTW